MKYENYGTYCWKVINKVNVSKKKVKSQGKKYDCTHGKVLSLEILMWNIKGLALMVKKLLGRLTFRTELQNDRLVKNNMPVNLRSRGQKKTCKEYIESVYIYYVCVWGNKIPFTDWLNRVLRRISSISCWRFWKRNWHQLSRYLTLWRCLSLKLAIIGSICFSQTYLV